MPDNTKKYFEDLYDQITVNLCRDIEEQCKVSIERNKENKIEFQDQANAMVHNFLLYFEQGERYLKREETIREWMEEDKRKNELLQNTKEPENIYCNTCGGAMYPETRTWHNDTLDSKHERVLFIFRCSKKCKKGRGVYSNGEEWIPKADLCTECKHELERTYDRQENKVFTYFKCLNCKYEETEELDLSEKKEESKDEFFNRDKARFCLSAIEGQKYLEGKKNLEQLKQIVDRMEEKEKNKELYQKVANIKKLTIMGLEGLLVAETEKEQYSKFELGKPEIGRDVFVEFTVRDAKEGREQYDSKTTLKKVIKDALKETNWRLMSEGIYYRLGFLTGRLRAYEKEEDLIKLIQKKK